MNAEEATAVSARLRKLEDKISKLEKEIKQLKSENRSLSEERERLRRALGGSEEEPTYVGMYPSVQRGENW